VVDPAKNVRPYVANSADHGVQAQALTRASTRVTAFPEAERSASGRHDMTDATLSSIDSGLPSAIFARS